MDLEDKLQQTAESLSISDERQVKIARFLILLKEKHLETYQHCLRVGEISRKIAEYLKIDEKAAWYGGNLHDIGKLLVDKSILEKKEGFNEEDMQKVRPHVVYGYQMLKDFFPFSAEIALRHHRFQRENYPHDIPEFAKHFSQKTISLINNYTRIVALADHYDAIKRRNDKFGSAVTDPKKARELIIQYNPDQISLLNDLYNNKVLN